MISTKRGGLLFAAAALSACGHSLSVRHYLAPGKLSAEQATGVSRMFLIVKAAPGDDATFMGIKLQSAKKGYEFTRGELDEFARRSMTALGESPAAFVGYQIHYTDTPPPWMADFAPTASIWLEPSRFEVKDGSSKSIHFTVKWRLYQEPGHALLMQGQHPTGGEAVVAGIVPGSLEDDALIKSRLWEAALKYAPALKDQILPRTVVRQRAIYKGQGRTQEAFKEARSGHLDAAARIWREEAQLQSPAWESAYNLGVYSEHEQKVSESKTWYLKATERAPSLVRTQIEAILGELARIMSVPKAAPAQTALPRLYKERIAVLPFTNETVDMSADSYLRLKTIEILQARGYPIAPMPEVDQKLAEKDIREGGHLRIMDEKQLAKLLSVDRLIYGNVEEFKVVNIGVFYKRHVEMTLRMTDAQGKKIWENTGRTIYQSSAKPKEAAAAFLVSLAATQIQKIAKTHLKAEADESVVRCLETLPRGFQPN